MESIGKYQTFGDDGCRSLKIPYTVRIEHYLSAELPKPKMVDPFIRFAVV